MCNARPRTSSVSRAPTYNITLSAFARVFGVQEENCGTFSFCDRRSGVGRLAHDLLHRVRYGIILKPNNVYCITVVENVAIGCARKKIKKSIRNRRLDRRDRSVVTG